MARNGERPQSILSISRSRRRRHWQQTAGEKVDIILCAEGDRYSYRNASIGSKPAAFLAG